MANLLRSLHNGETHTREQRDGPVIEGLNDSPAFNSPGSEQQSSENVSLKERVSNKAQKTARVIAHPRQAAKSHATSKLTANERPWLRNQSIADQEYFEAHDELEAAEKAGLPDNQRTSGFANGGEQSSKSGQNVEEQAKQLANIEEERRELQSGWHMSRYVRRVRAVRKGSLAFPAKHMYQVRDKSGVYVRTDWGRWIGHLIFWSCQDCSVHYIDPTNEVPYDREVLVSHIERLIIASEAFQLWWMRVRKVYTWEDPWLTAKWLILFLVLLKTGYVMSFYWVYLLYSVVTNRTGHHSKKWMRESHQRAHRAQERASMVSELVVRHGSEDWLEPLLDEFGPWIQLQLGDLADFLEVSANYYDWRNVRSTASTCVAYSALFLVSAIPKLDFSIKIFWFAGGLYFFLSRPISTRFPRFRHAVDPIRWMYWDSPTSSELVFDRLRTQAWSALEQSNLPDPVSAEELGKESDDPETFYDAFDTTIEITARTSELPAIVSVPAKWSNRSGYLELSSRTVRFVERKRSRGGETSICWEHAWSRLLEAEKTQQPSRPGSRIPPHALTLVWRDEGLPRALPGEDHADYSDGPMDVVRGMSMESRDHAFNAIVGMSGARWQELQPDPKGQDRKH